jgi:putative two-component system response regulator
MFFRDPGPAETRALQYDQSMHRSEMEVQIDFLRLEVAELTRQVTELHARPSVEALEQAYLDSLTRLVQASAFRDQETGAHIRRIGLYSRRIAMEMGLDAGFADLLGKAAPMHDVGKVGVPDAILHKNGPLSAEEWILMKRHCEIGAQLLAGSPSKLIQMAERVARSHHERFDGTGYPQGLAGTDIPMEARIVCIADVYDALRSPRPYKPSWPHYRACVTITEGDGRTKPEHFDPAVMAVFKRIAPAFDEIYSQNADPDLAL